MTELALEELAAAETARAVSREELAAAEQEHRAIQPGELPFAKWAAQAWPYQFWCSLHLQSIAGGVPSDPETAENWIKNKLAPRDARLQQMVAELMIQRGITAEEAASEVSRLKHLNGFKRDEDRGLYIEGRIIKAAVKEAASIAAAAKKIPLTKWGVTSKYLGPFVAEHIVVRATGNDRDDDHVYLGRPEPDDINQSFPENKRIGQRGIQLVEVCRDVDIRFRVMTDWEFSQENWAMIWLTGAEEGLGACRSQGFGRYQVTEWEPVERR